MKASTHTLHSTLIRLVKGCITAWETWLRKQHVDDDLTSQQR